MPEKQCHICNMIMFEAEPFKTTQQEIIEFAQQSSLPENQKRAIIQNKWLHAGYYCPNGCITILSEYFLPLPPISLSDSISIATEYSRNHFSEFSETHGLNSRIVACIFCKNFGGVVLEGESPTAIYHQPKYAPFRSKKIISAVCADSRIQELQSEWWYSKGKTQAECEYFAHGNAFNRAYKNITGWSEYPSE